MAFFRRVPELLPFFSKNQLKQNSGVQFLSDTARPEVQRTLRGVRAARSGEQLRCVAPVRRYILLDTPENYSKQ